MKTNDLNYVAYYRVSTTKQGVSGLGLEAQQADISRCLNGVEPVASFTDIESGKRSDNRPELLKAIELCKQSGATLIIAKLDRLSRNLVFIGTLMESKVKFKCCDMPEADSFTIHIFAAMAQKEREMISTRTKSALKALKDRGVKLGNPAMNDPEYKSKHLLKARNSRKPKEQDKQILFNIKQLQGNTLQYIADQLNELDIKTSKGCRFTPVQVYRLSKFII